MYLRQYRRRDAHISFPTQQRFGLVFRRSHHGLPLLNRRNRESSDYLSIALASIIFTFAAVVSPNLWAAGSEVFASKCSICHQDAGQGVPGTYPRLADAIGDYVRLPEGRAYLIHVVLFGMNGPIVASGQNYNGLMPPREGELTDQQI